MPQNLAEYKDKVGLWCSGREQNQLQPRIHKFLETSVQTARQGLYRAEKKSLQIVLSSTQAGPVRKVKQKQEEISRNHVPRLFLGPVHLHLLSRLQLVPYH